MKNVRKIKNNVGSLEAAEKQELVAQFKECADTDRNVALAAQTEFIAEIVEPINAGNLDGDIVGGIFERDVLEPGVAATYATDIVTPEATDDYVAFDGAEPGEVPDRLLGGGELVVQTKVVMNAASVRLRYVRDVRWPIIRRLIEVLEFGFVAKNNDDGWRSIISAGKANLDGGDTIVSDSTAAAGEFTKKLVSLMKTAMRRNAGGNSTSPTRGRLTDLFVSPEAIEDMRNWDVDQVDEVTRREIYTADDNSISRVMSVNIVDLDELGVGQVFQNYYTTTLSGTMAASDVEIVVGLDLSAPDSFVNPVREEIMLWPDESLHRKGLMGFYGWGERGYKTLDPNRVVLGSL